jgi:hypothetical protein
VISKFARPAFLDESTRLVLEDVLPRSIADMAVDAVFATEAFITRGVGLRQRHSLTGRLRLSRAPTWL